MLLFAIMEEIHNLFTTPITDMPKLREPSAKKDLLLNAVKSNPGLQTSQLAKLVNLPMWTVQKILPELAGRRLIYAHIAKKSDPRSKEWYPLGLMNTFKLNHAIYFCGLKEKALGLLPRELLLSFL